MAALTQEQLSAEISRYNSIFGGSMVTASEAVKIAKLILITHRVQDFTGGDVVALAEIITRGASDASR
jgi:hypothetical protein